MLRLIYSHNEIESWLNCSSEQACLCLTGSQTRNEVHVLYMYLLKKEYYKKINQQNIQIRLITRLLNFSHFPQSNVYDLSD